jgi:hypothetical protein
VKITPGATAGAMEAASFGKRRGRLPVPALYRAEKRKSPPQGELRRAHFRVGEERMRIATLLVRREHYLKGPLLIDELIAANASLENGKSLPRGSLRDHFHQFKRKSAGSLRFDRANSFNVMRP